jgi:hypothetical protein
MGIIETVVKERPHDDSPLGWELLVLTPEKIAWLWEQVKQFPIIFDDFGRGDFDAFTAKLTNPRNAFVDIGPGIGLACLMGIRPRLDALVHIVMFDRKLKGREPLFKEILQYAFNRLQLRRVTAMISSDASLAIALCKRMGWTHEGTMRQAMLRDGHYTDIEIYGLLREEL